MLVVRRGLPRVPRLRDRGRGAGYPALSRRHAGPRLEAALHHRHPPPRRSRLRQPPSLGGDRGAGLAARVRGRPLPLREAARRAEARAGPGDPGGDAHSRSPPGVRVAAHHEPSPEPAAVDGADGRLPLRGRRRPAGLRRAGRGRPAVREQPSTARPRGLRGGVSRPLRGFVWARHVRPAELDHRLRAALQPDAPAAHEGSLRPGADLVAGRRGR